MPAPRYPHTHSNASPTHDANKITKLKSSRNYRKEGCNRIKECYNTINPKGYTAILRKDRMEEWKEIEEEKRKVLRNSITIVFD